MTEIKPQFLDEESYAAKLDRQFPRDILTEGIVATGDLEITELDTPGMGVKAASGAGYVQGDQAATQGHYRIFNDASKNLSIAASDPTNPRKDRIIAQIYDSIDIGGADDKWVLEVLTGTPAPSPSPPALPNDALDLAIVLVGNGVTEILNADITDQRTQIALQNVTREISVEDVVNNVKARAYLSTNQLDIVHNTWTKVLLDSEDYDVGADFDIVNNKFIVPVTGYYLVIAQVQFTSVITDTFYECAIHQGATQIVSNRTHTSFASFIAPHTSTIAYFTANDEITLQAFHYAGVNTVDIVGGAGNYTYLAIHLLSV